MIRDTIYCKEFDCKELAHVFMEAEKSQHLQLASLEIQES